MKRVIMTYGGYFERFMMTLTDKEQKKINYILSLLETESPLYLMMETLLSCSMVSVRKARRLRNMKY